MAVTRAALATPLSGLITASLIYLMYALIDIGPNVVTPDRLMAIDWRPFVREDTPVNEIIEKPEPPLDVEPVPDTPTPRFDGVDFIDVPTGRPTPMTPVPGFGQPFSPAQSGEHTPVVRVEPQYPRRLAAQGVEGYVVVQFTVTSAGTVADAVAIESSDRRFEKAALDAVFRFKYRPRIVDGQPVAVNGVRNLFRFTLKD